MTEKEMKKFVREFAADYGDLLAIKANVVAINQILIGRGKYQELFKDVKYVMENHRKKVGSRGENNDQ